MAKATLQGPERPTGRDGFLERPRAASRFDERLLVVAVGVLVAGAVAITVALFAGSAADGAPVSGDPRMLAPQKTVPVSAAAKAVATAWILGAVNRSDLAGTYDLTHTDIRGSLTRAEWETGDIPVIPYPVESIGDGRWHVDTSYEGEALLQVELTPTAGSSQRALTFYIGLKKVGEGAGARWVVNYWSPRYRPPVRLAR